MFPKLYKRTKDPAKGRTQQHITKPHGFAKAELESLKFERSLLHEAITRIYEAVQEGRIDAMERDRLLLKYKRQLVIYDEKIDALLPLVDLSELNNMRDDVVNLLEQRIGAIDQQLAELSKKSETLPANSSIFQSNGSTHNSSPILTRDNRQQRQGKSEADREQLVENDYHVTHGKYAFGQDREYKKPYNIYSTGENTSESISEGSNIEKLQDEIMEALSRLEQAGMNSEDYKEYDNMNRTSDNNDKNSNFSGGQHMEINSNTNDKSCLRQLR